ncbi:MAG: hypothetical protein ACE5JL_08050 [Dehalococcoidia bacterium]
MGDSHEVSNRTVKFLQWTIVGGALLFILAIIVWIGHLIRTAWWLHDTPSASIGISLVAVPIFLTLAGVIFYVAWGLLEDRRDQ